MASGHLYEQIARNKRHSWLLVMGITILLILVGLMVGLRYGDPWVGLLLAGGFALFYTATSLLVGDKLVLAIMRAKLVTPGEHQQLMNIVEEMCIASGLPHPKVYVINSKASNAFATGNSPKKASVAVTTGLLEILNREELQAVLGHEMAHIKNFDTRFAVLMAVMVGAIIMMSDAFLRMGRGSKRSNSKGGGNAFLVILAVVLLILAPLAAKLIQFTMSRRRELLADNTSAELTRNPEALANALEKIAGDPDPLDIKNRGTQHLFIVNPVRALADNKRKRKNKPPKEKAGWFDTHPPVALRVRLLREMAQGRSGVQAHDFS